MNKKVIVKAKYREYFGINLEFVNTLEFIDRIKKFKGCRQISYFHRIFSSKFPKLLLVFLSTTWLPHS